MGGSVEITICCLGYFFKTRAPGRFPILIHQVFTMEGYFKEIYSFSNMDRILGKFLLILIFGTHFY